ncbi:MULTISPECIES: replication initiation protein [Paraburkholderia]|uniref:Replication initiation protein n=1 Tax=Paraburkholderia madseniana TaxID=2599607 RepID=A0AAP5BJW3_9BURK|nr:MULTISPECIES: replication initiation protein [Paraburkholderia]MCX4150032.1 replication initiation protein [Paraburkholderia madseniana]MCX4175677.1 replication initiation protein [Paraburkholderia madseniana]MDN7152968.1 replication initiation protein [Paraburkholderia sp. WS6]MDQ6411850.1 replication initiation protein [Paraburkholderia madseniana]MDQ6463672.1 replication initiation protein [Paraburkholderia madseniana]
MASSVERRVTPLQYALDLFVEMAPARGSINEAVSDKDIGYQKNRVFARIIGLGLSARRFVDAAYFIVAQDPEIQEAYDVTLSFFKWLMRYDSKNKKHFSSVIRSVKSSMLEVTSAPVVSVDSAGRMVEESVERGDEKGRADDDEADKDLVVETEDGDWLELIGRVSVRNGRIRFRVPVELQRLIKDPENSYWTSLLITSRFTLIYARAIYDHVLPFVPNAVTEWLPLDLVRNLPGKSWANNAEFKYFKRDYLEPAVSQINELSDIELTYETRAGTPGSRKKDQIRFRLKRKEASVASKADMLNSVALFMTLQNDFALSEKQFETIAQNRAVWTDERIQQAIEYTRWRIRQGDKIKTAAGYMMKALSDNYRVSEADKQIELIQAQLVAATTVQKESKSDIQKAVADNLAAANAAAEQRRHDEIRLAREYFDTADKKKREDLVRKFVASSTMGLRAIERQMLKPAQVTEANILTFPDIANTFGSFVAGELRKAGRAPRK